MKKIASTPVLLALLLCSSCLKDIDTEPLPLPEVEDVIVVKHSIKQYQSFYRLYETNVIEVDAFKSSKWDLAFESAGDGNRVMLGWSTFSTAVPSGLFSFEDLNQDLILELIDSAQWVFDDPSNVNIPDSLALTGHWENGEIWIQNRGVTDDNYYAIQFISSDESSYSFRYASALSLSEQKEATVYRVPAYNYVHFSYDTDRALTAEPDMREWDIECGPYRGWWETDDPGIYAPFNMSGILINNEAGVRVAKIDDPDVSFAELDYTSIKDYEFTDKKGAIGSDWKLLGDPNSGNIFSMDPDKKYMLMKILPETGDSMYFKLQVIDYKNQAGEDHYPTIEYKILKAE